MCVCVGAKPQCVCIHVHVCGFICKEVCASTCVVFVCVSCLHLISIPVCLSKTAEVTPVGFNLDSHQEVGRLQMV